MNLTCNGTASNSILEDWLFQSSAIVTFLLSLVSVAANLLILACFYKLNASHLNIRILSCNLSLACVFGSLYFIWRCFSIWLNSTTACGLHMTAHICSLSSLPARITSIATMTTMLGIATERCSATVYHQTYNSRSRRLPIAIVIISWLLYPVILPITFFHSPRMAETPFCVPLLVENYIITVVGASVSVIVGIGSIIAYLKLIFINKRRLREFAKEQVHLSLSSRMEMRQNVELTLLYLPSVCLHTALWVTYGLLMPFVLYGISDDCQSIKFGAGVCLNNLYCAFMAVHPILLFSRSDRLRSKLKSFWNRFPLARLIRLKTKRRISPPIESHRNVCEETFTVQEHFNHLQTYWLPPRIRGKTNRSAYTVS